MDATLLQKVEELTLYAIEQKKIGTVQAKLASQQRQVERYEARANVQQNQLGVQERRIQQLEHQVEEQKARFGRQKRQLDAMKEQIETLHKRLSPKNDSQVQ